MSRFVAVLCLWLLPGMGVAQSVVGSSTVDGRAVELLSNNTWRFSATSAAPEGCFLIELPVSLCGGTDRWQRVPVSPTPAVDAMFQLDDRNYAMLIIEGVGRMDGLTEQSLQEIVLFNASSAAGVPPSAIPILESYETTIDGQSYPTFTFSAEVQGLSFVYNVSLILQDRSAIQVTTYTIGAGLQPNQRTLHNDFASRLQVAN
ncbi:MAG: hypothetical protein AAGA70_11230 [Pseudomonadota bacterium]